MKTRFLLLFFFLPVFFLLGGKRLSKKNYEPGVPVACIHPDNDTATSDFSMLDSAVGRYRFFIAGEVHHVSANPKVYIKLIRYLYFHAHVRNLVFEYGPSEMYLFQRYLDTGDETWVKDSWMFAFNDYVTFWRQLYAFNKSVPEKLRLIGVDFDCDHYFAKVVAALCPAGHTPPNAIRPMIDSVMRIKSEKPFNTVDNKFIGLFKNDYLLHRFDYDNYFGENMGILNELFDNEASYAHMRERDYQMLYNFFTYGIGGPQSSYFGMFGKFHTSLYGNSTFAAMLNNGEMDSTFVHKVMTVYLIYDSCNTYFNNKLTRVTPADDFGSLSVKKNNELLSFFRDNAPCDNVLFGLRKCDNDAINGLQYETKYVIYLKNHPAVVPNPSSRGYFPKLFSGN